MGAAEPPAGLHHRTPSDAAMPVNQRLTAGRPVAVAITWFSGGSHFVAIAGVLGDSLLILDPASGQSVVRFGDFPGTYFGGAKLDGYALTKA